MNLAARIFDSGMAILAHRWHGLHSGNGAVLWKTATGSWCSRHYTASCNNVSLNYYMVTGGSHENHSFYRAVARMKEEERWKEEERKKEGVLVWKRTVP